MRILVHDYSGHPFQIQLSRELSRRGHDVLHVYSASFETPHGDLSLRADDSPMFGIEGVSISEPIVKQGQSLLKRFRLEREYGEALVRRCSEYKPELLISANTPSIVQRRLADDCTRRGVTFFSWIQDLNGLAALKILRAKVPVVGGLVGKYLMHQDRMALRASRGAVAITEDFVPWIVESGLRPDQVHVIRNWAAIDDVPVLSRDNAWSREHKLTGEVRFLYSGTLALKQNPRPLLELARWLQETGKGRLMLVSQGAAVDWLKQQAAESGIHTLDVFGFQPSNRFAEVLASADVLVATLEADAGAISVPSKVLSYLCAGRPLLLAVPTENLSARIVSEANAGFVVESDDVEGFLGAAKRLAGSPGLRAKFGSAGREYAERNFTLSTIADRFENVLKLKVSRSFGKSDDRTPVRA